MSKVNQDSTQVLKLENITMTAGPGLQVSGNTIGCAIAVAGTTATATAGELELRAIGLHIVDEYTRCLGDVVLNPVTVSLRRRASLVSILRERSTVEQVSRSEVVDVHAAVFLDRITGRQHSQRYCEQ